EASGAVSVLDGPSWYKCCQRLQRSPLKEVYAAPVGPPLGQEVPGVPTPAEPPDLALVRHTLTLFRNPLDAEAYSQPACLLYQHFRSFPAARDDFSMFLALNPNHAESYHLRAHVYEHLGQFAKAIDDFSEAIQRQPNNAHLHDARGHNYLRRNEHAQAAA